MKKKYIVMIIIGALLIYALPTLIILIGVGITSIPIKYKEEGSKIIIEKYGITMDVVNNYYNEETKCYTIETIIEKDKKNKKGNTLSINYDLKNKDGYSLGTVDIYLDDLNSNNKWKKSIDYCENYAEEVDNFKIKNIYSY